MSRFDARQDKLTPVLSRLAMPSNTTTVADLSDIKHPVNIKSLSGKAVGMGLMIDGNIYVATGSNPSDSWNQLGGSSQSTGFVSIFNEDLTPVAIPENGEVKLPLAATDVDESFLPVGVSGLWNPTTNQFDFSSLDIGDTVDLRVDGSLTNTGFNESFRMLLRAAIGSPSQYELPLGYGNRLFAGTSGISRYNGFFIGSADMRDNPAEIIVTATASATCFLTDIYIRVTRKG